MAFGLLVAALPAPPPGPRERPLAPRRGAVRLLFGLPLDVNREAAEQLEALPGIGPARARAIEAGRPYCRIDDLRRVAGIGPVTLRRIRGRLTTGAGVCAPRRGD